MSNLKISRGRGNQGDWVNNRLTHGTLPEHRDHNTAVEAKRQAKLLARKRKRSPK